MEHTDRKHWIRLTAFALVLVAVSLMTTWVGLAGSWVGDDWHMVGNYLYGDWAELGAVFQRNAAYYLFTDDKVGPYRPVTMLTLLATHLLAPEPWLHHLVSWILHAVTALLLFGVLRQVLSRSEHASVGEPDTISAFLAGIFFLNPVHVEAYVWINGRSDLLGGFWLVALAFLLHKTLSESSARLGSVLVIGLVGFLGASSKLPFVIAAGAVWLAWAIRDRSPLRAIYGAALAGGVGVHLVLRSIFAPFRGQLGTSGSILLEQDVWLTLPKLFGRGLTALMVLRAEAMQSLSWILFGPWSLLAWIGFALIALILVVLVRRRAWTSLVYFVGAFLTLAPVVVVSRSFWMGFDRYLYMPSILLMLAVAQAAAGRRVAVPKHQRAGRAAFGVAFLFLAAVGTSDASRAYANQEAFDRALLRDHADDPTIHYYFARAADRSGDTAGLREHLSAMPSPPWPRPIIAPTYELAAKVSDNAKARTAIRALVDSENEGVPCSEIQQQLVTWRDRAPNPATADALTASLTKLSCER